MSSTFPDIRHIFIVAGEASGDMHGAGLVKAIRKKYPDIRFSAIGGEKMKEAGVPLIFPNSDLAVVGLFEVISHARPVIKAFRKTVTWLDNSRPDLLILIDYPEFNMLLAARARKFGIPVMYFISPQIWAWRQGRVHRLKKLVDRMAVILPFEKEFYAGYGMNVDFVGHPLVDTVKPQTDRETFCINQGFEPTRPIFSLLPGSRGGELKRLLPLIFDAAEIMQQQKSDLQFVVPFAPGLKPEFKAMIEEKVARLQAKGLLIKTVEGMTWDAIEASRLAVAASGTVTLEAAILGTPSVVVYNFSPVTYYLGRHLIKVKYASLINLIADREILPELLQKNATPAQISAKGLELLTDTEKYDRLREEMSEAVKTLGPPGAFDRAADIALEFL